jgi:hypothetical protein
MPHIYGIEFHGELVSSNASAGVFLTLYEGASLTARTILADEYVTVTDIINIDTDSVAYNLLFAPVGGAVADGAGLRIAKGTSTALGGLAHHFETPRIGPKGYAPAMIAAAGSINVIITGFISGGSSIG